MDININLLNLLMPMLVFSSPSISKVTAAFMILGRNWGTGQANKRGYTPRLLLMLVSDHLATI